MPTSRWIPLAVCFTLLATGTVALAADGWRPPALLIIGAALGAALYVTSFGFTTMYRRAFTERDYTGIYAQLLMLGAATVLFAPILATGAAFGQQMTGALAPASLSVLLGAFMFGTGMQIAGGCASGTLYSAGGGNTRMLITLTTFIAGGFWASLHMPFWGTLPSLGTVSLGARLGWPAAVATQLALLGTIALILRLRSTERSDWRAFAVRHRLVLTGAAALAVLNFVTLLVAGRPWTITWAFTLWGAKTAANVGWDPATAPFWSSGFPDASLANPVARDTTSIMNVGIILGALGSAAAAGRFTPKLEAPSRMLFGTALGGLLLGYGARIAFGCNIGAFFSGVASTSLHGWLWIVAALGGTWLGIRLRPWFGHEG